MRHLVIYSHPYPKSFNHAILETYSQALRDAGHEVRIRDLYALNFDPVLKAHELAGFPEGKIPEDIRIEQEHVRWAEILTLICPIWFGGFTANLRGYLDRVFSLGFAYNENAKGLLTDKKAFLINTIGAPLKVYEEAGLIRAMNVITDEIIFPFCGVQVVGHQFFGSVTTCSDAERRKMLEAVQTIARDLK
jgi:NAD(P)H dehydrogenase (quinone)